MLPKKSLVAVISLTASLPLMALDDTLSEAMDLPTVLSATRLKQAPAEVPGSMTILNRQLIRASGARDIPELMRLVPGMKVGYRNGHIANVNYHGTNFNEARRMQVLIDGRSVYRPGLANVDWSDIPLAIEDIERIEIMRGPNTAAFGANALMGVINIISTRPELSQGSRVKITRGQRGVDDFYARQGIAFGNTYARLSLIGKQDDGFELDEDGNDYRDGRRLNAVNLLGNTDISPTQTLSWQLGAKEGSNQRANDYTEMAEPSDDSFLLDRLLAEELSSDSDIRARDYFIQLHWKNELSPDHRLEVKTYAQHMERLTETRACDSPIVFSPEMRELYLVGNVFPRRMNYILRNRSGIWADPAYYRPTLVNRDGLPPEYLQLIEDIIDQHAAVRNGPPTCFNLNENLRETRFEVELQNTVQITSDLRSVFGVNLRHDQASSQTLFGGRVNNTIGQLFGNLEYRINQRWLLHAGAMAEEDQLSGFSFSPRLAAHYFMRPTHSLRAVYSEAVRSPDMYENNAYWTYRPSNLEGAPTTGDTYYALAEGPGDLKQERMRSVELGYNGHFHHSGLSIDIKLFYDEIRDMISQPLQIVNFVPDNSSFARFKGGETQVDWQANRNHRLRATYAYVDFTATNRLDQRLTSRHSGSAGWIANWNNQLETSVFYYGAQKLNEFRFERLDARIATNFRLTRDSNLELAMVWQHRLDDEPLTRDDNNFKNQNYYQLSAELNF
ncbi:TonB-dependent receptor plug domain-containing protein [Halopseudomonas salegens]|uniref:Iron complex outermembrane recepter protein n=1 Tax=Halopseudomonas salegens TaxID=1434072 RepID=A0A1H2FS38_9GAMM|nr:TonB-dependent receptor [Halopseudomonas salegens]SDU10142.1 iron complex outermembrane recepter protein [Halopseudomonas salegens]